MRQRQIGSGKEKVAKNQTAGSESKKETGKTSERDLFRQMKNHTLSCLHKSRRNLPTKRNTEATSETQ